MSALMIASPKGSTRFLAVVGDPVAQVKAPEILNRYFAENGLDMIMIPVHACRQNLYQVVRGLQAIENFHGMLITVPHKFAAVGLAHIHSRSVVLSGSTNALCRGENGLWTAENFDGVGFVLGLQRAGFELTGKRVLLAGGGGAGSAIAAALLEAGISTLYLQEPDRQKAAELIQRLERQWPGRIRKSCQEAAADVALAINASPLGLHPDDPLPIDLSSLDKNAWVADIIMKPAQTRLLTEASESGFRVHLGIHMLTEQFDCYRRFFSF